MFKEQMNKIKALIIKDAPSDGAVKKDKRKIENLVAFLIILIVTIIIINMILKGNGEGNNDKGDSAYKYLAVENTISNNNNNETEDELEKRIERILETMTGVRKSKCTCYIFTNKWSYCNV